MILKMGIQTNFFTDLWRLLLYRRSKHGVLGLLPSWSRFFDASCFLFGVFLSSSLISSMVLLDRRLFALGPIVVSDGLAFTTRVRFNGTLQLFERRRSDGSCCCCCGCGGCMSIVVSLFVVGCISVSSISRTLVLVVVSIILVSSL